MRRIWIAALSLSLALIAVDASAQQKLAPKTKTLKGAQTPQLKMSSAAARNLDAKKSTYKSSNAPQAKTPTGERLRQLDASSPKAKTKTNGLIGEDGLRASLRARREGAEEILREATQLKKDALASKRDAKTLRAIDGLVRDAQATIRATNGLIGEDGKRAFSKGDYARLGASDAQAKRLQGSLESVLGLVEPIIMR